MPPPIVLIVDDDADFRVVLGDLLRDEGYRIVEAANGEEALRVLDSLKPDVIVIDLIMPVVNGWALFAAIERRRELRGVPLVFLSAVPKTAPGGGWLVLQKPLKLHSLLTLLTALRHEPDSSKSSQAGRARAAEPRERQATRRTG
jgi:CheY-like chemotaxis protein